MTEKRFIVIDDGLDFMIRDTITDDDLIDADGVADVLNDYEKENEQLKSEIENGMESFKRIQRCHTLTLVEENEQLKRQIGNFEHTKDFVADVCADCKRLEKENEQLKSEINGLEELLKSYRKTIKHDAELLADASKKGYLPPLKNWREL